MNELVRFALVAFFPRVDDLPGLAELGVDERIRELRRDATRLFWVGVVFAALFFQLTPVLTVRRLVPAVSLTPEELDRHAHEIATHPSYWVRQIMVLLKLVAGLFWGQTREVRAKMALPAYDPDPGTRRTEAHVPRTLPPSRREPKAALVTLGRSEEERGRGQLARRITERSPS